MGDRLIEFSLKNRFLVLLATALIAGAGFLAMRKLPIDADRKSTRLNSSH